MSDTEAASPAAPTTQAPNGGKPKARKLGLTILAIVVVAAAIVWAVFHFLLAKPEEETDDAYVAGDVVAITARDPGTVLAIHADNTQTVKAGAPLLDLDPATADVGLASAAAELARAVRATRADFTKVNQSGAAIVQAQAELTRARADYARRQGAAAEGAVSGEELSHAADAVKVATANLTLARAQAAQARTAVQGTDVNTNPAVLAAIAAYRRAAIMRSHMHITAPIDGVIAQRTVQVGQQVAAGTPLMAVVPLDRLWVDANFRETQLRDLRIGQPATITADMYGGKIVYHGKVIGLGAGSGNAFALLPPQNASGNWIKIVQRVPVRIGLNANELRQNPLRVGLSATVTVDTADQNGPRIGTAATQAYQTRATDGNDPAIEARIAQIIAANR
ncbi:efflux RND transporter periplasmic adaptor subunit [Sphingomonas sanguinis]|jgi:membrane fusion protein (multidrug efflux system)|uniref:Efflux RND transporter periplasmic adaptor subunit n=1 Tax=Sphingomonas sanguinis TaxID=33051 RepID=A0A7Y7QX02_9SPHN|nr:efflux RND transporter periplasmic adaptor subunit [Sphingomonas sanguinis]MBZ6382295.1 efflux RND transporter periplasmic adaptor subunit [Sphingomonas sanguinis]NNG50881.1 HlyD family efflux transporter periplasmic adaptor subunit [Sphingomonas sanguinis]NNG54331.1 HlyD family efflux transporter periplasmic adaptor subunit [Sphingomonas sanguinis]NVP31593.1 efflux RND transporter periplasmic adaptor subunit [Sphingomonas sanguinis]HJO67355.1 efflux RND transporter periplasmic adaptor subu